MNPCFALIFTCLKRYLKNITDPTGQETSSCSGAIEIILWNILVCLFYLNLFNIHTKAWCVVVSIYM